MLNYELMYKGLIDVTKTVVGSRLSTTPLETGTTPSVSKARTGRPQVDSPYITIDLGATIQPLGEVLDSYLDSDIGLPTYEILHEVFFTWRCYGDESESILQQFRSSLVTPYTINNILSTTGGLAIRDKGAVIPSPTLLSTRYREGSRLTCSFYIVDKFTDPYQEGDYAISLKGDGKLITGVNGDIPLPIDVTKP
jgi:hypothetical protein